MTLAGLPHSEIHGSRRLCNSPWCIAAFRVLLRLLVPRHSPCALGSFTYYKQNKLLYLVCLFIFYLLENYLLAVTRLQTTFELSLVSNLYLHNSHNQKSLYLRTRQSNCRCSKYDYALSSLIIFVEISSLLNRQNKFYLCEKTSKRFIN